jgi:hypothetical protein
MPSAIIQDLSTFLKLPGELRNQIYELVFCSARLDIVILINDLERRKCMRSFRAKNYKLYRTTKAMVKPYHMINETAATITRLSVPIVGLPPIFETSILRVCRQTYQEARGSLANTTFAYYLPLSGNSWRVPYPCPSIEPSQVRRFCLEMQLPVDYSDHSPYFWSEAEKRLCLFRSMSNFRQLQLVITYQSAGTVFNSNGMTGLQNHDYSKLMQTIVKMIPRSVSRLLKIPLSRTS